MTAIEVLNQIKQAGGTVEVLDQDLRLRVPKGFDLDQEQRQVLAEHKAELVRLLAPAPVKVQTVVEDDYETAERAAIEWEAGLDQDQADTVANAAIEAFDRFIRREQLAKI